MCVRAYITPCLPTQLYFNPRPVADLNAYQRTTSGISTQREEKLISLFICNHLLCVCRCRLIFHEKCTLGLVWQLFLALKFLWREKEKKIFKFLNMRSICTTGSFKIGLAHYWLPKYMTNNKYITGAKKKGFFLP